MGHGRGVEARGASDDSPEGEQKGSELGPELTIDTRGRSSGWRAHLLLAKPSLFAEGSGQGHFFVRFRLNCTRCISIAPAMLDRYLAALPAMSLIPFAPFFTADFFALLLPLPMSALAAR